MRSFPTNDGSFTFGIPVVIAKNAGGLDDAMTGNDKRNWVVADGCSNSAAGFRIINLLGDLAISGELARWNCQ